MLIITVGQRQNLVLGEYVKIRYKNLFLSSSLVDANSVCKFVQEYVYWRQISQDSWKLLRKLDFLQIIKS